MEVILLERVEKLGAIGDVVKVKDGFARNFLLPNKKALRANDANRKLFETNLLAPLALVQAAFPHMVRRRTGRIVNIGSVVGILPTPFAGSYCASKAGLHMLSDVLRMEVAPFGIDVIVVQPGGVRSTQRTAFSTLCKPK